MKKNSYWLFLVLFGVAVLTSCSDDDDDIRVSDVPVEVQNNFQSKFPGVNTVEWERKKNYYVADFWQSGMEVEAWFDDTAVWKMTEYDLGIQVSNLPLAIQNAFMSGQYAMWQVDDIDKYERTDRTFYLIEVETNGQKDRDLYYGEDGTLLKDEVDTNTEITPSTVL